MFGGVWFTAYLPCPLYVFIKGKKNDFRVVLEVERPE